MQVAIKSMIYGVVLALALVTSGLVVVFKMGWYVLLPTREFAALTASQAMLSKVGEWNKLKRTQLKTKIAKKASKRMATSAAATVVPIVASVAVTATTAYFLIEDHCEAVAESFELEQMISGQTEKFDTTRCLSEMKSESNEWVADAKKEGEERLEELRTWIHSLKSWR